MLIEFSVKNFRSIKDKQTLSMVAGTGTELLETNTVIPDGRETRLVRSAALYGPNGSGKSNFLDALSTMKHIVVNSAKESSEGDEIDVKPFLFNKSAKQGPTEFEAIFVHDGVRYQYGYSTNRKRVLEEWLIAYPTPRAQRWYAREFDQDEKRDDWHFGGKLTGQRSTWATATRDNALFLSTAVMLNSEQLRPVYEWFDRQLKTIPSGSLHPSFTVECLDRGRYNDGIHQFMKAADVGISGVEIDKRKFNADELPAELSGAYREIYLREFEGQDIFDIRFLHTVGDESVPLGVEDESAGTQRLFAFAGPLMSVFEHGYTLVVDELSNSLHPLMTRFLVGLFHDSDINKNGAQLIFTTHDTSNFNEKVLRRDQIWLFDANNKDRSTRLNPLTDFKPRKDVEPLEKNYLLGRYGALPYIEYPGGPSGKPH